MPKSAGQKKLEEMRKYLDSSEISEFAENKKGFEKTSKAFLRQLLGDISKEMTDKRKELVISESKVSFNPGGPAVAGDPSLYLMTIKNKGLAVYISDSFMNSPQKQCILFREISSMKDFRGGANNWLSADKPYEEIVAVLSDFLNKAIDRDIIAVEPQKTDKPAADEIQAAIENLTAPKTEPAEKSGKPDKVKEILGKLETGIKELFSSEKYMDYLKTMSKFHRYSFRNTLLIAMQKPDATLVAGFNTWANNFERHVSKGEKGIRILAPAPFKVKKEMKKIDELTGLPVLDKRGKPVMEEQEVTIPYFKVVNVFDISQTYGKEIPELLNVNELTGDVKDYEKFFSVLKEVSPYPIEIKKLGGCTKGLCDYSAKKIEINEGMSEIQNIKTAIHEITHAKLHERELTKLDLTAAKNRKTKEVEAESVAYVVCQHFGIDTSDYSFGYIAEWGTGREMPELKASLETINAAACELINKIEGKLETLEKELKNEELVISNEELSEDNKPETPDNPKPLSIPNSSFLTPNSQIGNTKYSQIENKSFFKIGNELAGMVAGRLEEMKIAFNGRVDDEKTTFTLSKSDAAAFKEIVRQVKELIAENVAADRLPDRRRGAEKSVSNEENKLLNGNETSFGIYQVKDGKEYKDIRFSPLIQLEKDGAAVLKDNYNLVYTASVSEEQIKDPDFLESLFYKFNMERPDDYAGRSLSVSDVVVLNINGEISSHFCDSVGFPPLNDFTGKEKVAVNEFIPIYMQSFEYSYENGESEAFNASMAENRKCVADIDKAVSRHADYESGIYDLKAALSEVTEKYGLERVSCMVASTVKHCSSDGRISKNHREWADGIETPDEVRLPLLNTHMAVVDGLIRHIIKARETDISNDGLPKKMNIHDKLQAYAQNGASGKDSKEKSKERTEI